MKSISLTTKALLLAAATPFAFAGTAAFAQDATASAPAQESPAATPVQNAVNATTDQTDPAAAQTAGDEIVVTGSLFRRTDTETPSPVTVLTSQTLQRAGVTTIADALRSVSADSAGSIPTGFQGGFSAGGSAVSLRGLGVSSTLILIDGLRSSAFPINDDGHNSYTDLNSIPFSAVERVEVLKDGASSTYGADAIGGVVNVILKKRFTGVTGTVEGGIAEHGYGSRYRANMTAGVGDYDTQNFNFYVNGEYQRDGRISGRDVGFPYNTNDLSSLGLADNNAADSSLTTATTNAVVVRAGQTDLNNPLAGSIANTPSGLQANGNPFYNFQLLNANCPNGTYTLTTGTNRGTGCSRNITSDYSQVQPLQEKFSFTSRLSLKISDNVEAYVLGSYSHSQVNIIYPTSSPSAIRQRQPYGASPLTASNNPGIVLPQYICASGINCATSATRTLNPNNPFAAEGSAARIYYLFGDLLTGSNRGNEVIRGAIGFNGTFDGGWDWRVEAVGARDNLKIEQFGTPSIAGLQQAVNTGAYNFVNPELNTEAVRQLVAPNILARSSTSLASLDASVSKELFQLPGGPLQLAVGGQVRRETLDNPGTNPDLLNYSNTAAAFGKHTVSAGYFELNAPIVKQFEVNASGRYDHYSEGFSHFSPKIGAKFTPIEQLSVRGTYSNGFRAPTFAESNPRSSYPGFVTFAPPASFVLAHGGSSNPYAQSYSVGGGFSGNPDLKPEKSRSFTGGLVFAPNRVFSLTVDYYNVKKSDVIVAGPNAGDARAAYYSQTNLAAATAAVAAIPGYSVGAVDAIDPLFPNALPRVLVINGPYVNAGYFKTQGIDYSATAAIPINDDVKFTSRLDVTQVLKFNVDFGDGVVRKYVGTLGPYELSSGAGTPKWRGNWQNTLELGPLSLTATAYYVSKIRQVAADEEAADANGNIDLSCATAAGSLYAYPTAESQAKYCNVKRFIYADLNATVKVNEDFSFYVNVGNFTNEKAPLAPASYSGVNYLPSWHYAGVVGRTFRAGATFAF
ncbi:TonB-dependent receptor [Sphingomonas sp. Leaf208]|jgi:iron complex outermembrane receptor protein|uniref:TonB-dependent receptor plug domain-containing protein n=1 Tax=Sphingomonas sp. Leaf208 TaxID=1735679 RepID=UPI0006F75FDC|nr:TonB-dependent receptor [Sphingomonas sp. Leaf208]KQM52425.1 TonB-dependent receptor [Sphingomonas sp. Leaf208]